MGSYQRVACGAGSSSKARVVHTAPTPRLVLGIVQLRGSLSVHTASTLLLCALLLCTLLLCALLLCALPLCALLLCASLLCALLLCALLLCAPAALRFAALRFAALRFAAQQLALRFATLRCALLLCASAALRFCCSALPSMPETFVSVAMSNIPAAVGSPVQPLMTTAVDAALYTSIALHQSVALELRKVPPAHTINNEGLTSQQELLASSELLASLV